MKKKRFVKFNEMTIDLLKIDYVKFFLKEFKYNDGGGFRCLFLLEMCEKIPLDYLCSELLIGGETEDFSINNGWSFEKSTYEDEDYQLEIYEKCFHFKNSKERFKALRKVAQLRKEGGEFYIIYQALKRAYNNYINSSHVDLDAELKEQLK